MIEFDCDDIRPSPRLIVAFTGVMHALGGVSFEFHKSLSGRKAAAMFVRDRDVAWYQNAGDAALILGQIEWARRACGATQLCCLGNSMGGFGALYFAARAQADAVIAFVPQTAVTPEFRASIGDTRWSEEIARIQAFPFGDLTQTPAPKGKITICYGTKSDLDVAHVDHLARAWDFERLAVQGVGHGAVTTLKESGRLDSVINDALMT